MKFYLFISLFFLHLLLLPSSASTQENSSTTTSAESSPSADSLPQDQQNHLDIQPDLDHREMPDVWSEHHVARESDTFQAKFLNMLFILGLLIGFMVLASWALKRMMKTKMTHLNTSHTIKLLETRYLSPRATLYLVEVQNKTFLIAESPTTVSYLASLPPEKEEEHTPPPVPPFKLKD